jgi:UDP-N-acetyl-D-mannosaminuronate dehydrogenase
LKNRRSAFSRFIGRGLEAIAFRRPVLLELAETRQHGLASEFIELAGEVNTTMPSMLLSDWPRLAERHESGRQQVCIVGSPTNATSPIPRESPAV